jgi:hypothetical protein
LFLTPRATLPRRKGVPSTGSPPRTCVRRALEPRREASLDARVRTALRRARLHDELSAFNPRMYGTAFGGGAQLERNNIVREYGVHAIRQAVVRRTTEAWLITSPRPSVSNSEHSKRPY